MDEILRSGALDKLPPRHKEHHPHVKREDVELIVSLEPRLAGCRPLERGTESESMDPDARAGNIKVTG